MERIVVIAEPYKMTQVSNHLMEFKIRGEVRTVPRPHLPRMQILEGGRICTLDIKYQEEALTLTESVSVAGWFQRAILTLIPGDFNHSYFGILRRLCQPLLQAIKKKSQFFSPNGS